MQRGACRWLLAIAQALAICAGCSGSVGKRLSAADVIPPDAGVVTVAFPSVGSGSNAGGTNASDDGPSRLLGGGGGGAGHDGAAGGGTGGEVTSAGSGGGEAAGAGGNGASGAGGAAGVSGTGGGEGGSSSAGAGGASGGGAGSAGGTSGTGASGAGGGAGTGGDAGASGAGGGAGTGGGAGAGGAGSGGAGTSGAGAGGAGAGGSGGCPMGAAGTGDTGPQPTKLPSAKNACESFATGDMMFAGQKVRIWAGAPAHGPLLIYWYATGGTPDEVLVGLGQPVIDQITCQGGVVAAMYKTTGTGTNTGNGVWYTDDFNIADEIVACAIEKQDVDTRRIHALGFSAGGLQTGYMAYARSNYLASVVTYSGGSLTTTLQDPGNPPAMMCEHGDPMMDVVYIDFSTLAANLESNIQSKGGFAIDCNHGGAHYIPNDQASVWRFLQDHPYKVSPEPYAKGIPAGFPSYCKIP